MTDETPLVTYKGVWKFVGDRLEMETEGLLWGTNKLSWRYAFKGDTLYLYDCDKVEGFRLELHQVK